jgi:hypothetical protein
MAQSQNDGEITVAAKFFAPILADGSSFDNYESVLELPSGHDHKQNAWLTITLKVHVNFVSSTTTGLEPKVAKQADGKTYARDWSGWLFPIKDWDNTTMDDFNKGYQKHGENVWNYKFLLLPQGYAGLDLQCNDLPPGMALRPNVICLFRLQLVAKGYHKLINVVRLDQTAKKVKNADPTKNKTAAEKTVGAYDAGTWRSDAEDYDDSDLFAPYSIDLTNPKGEIVKMAHDTIGHEIGHAIGQSHILGLEGTKKYQMGEEGAGDDEGYGKTFEEKANIMGHGNQLSTINSISWYRRLYKDTGTTSKDWQVSMFMDYPPLVVPSKS